MSAVRLEPLITQAKEFFSSISRSEAWRNNVWRSGTSCETLAKAM
jgi:hypothetical protein